MSLGLFLRSFGHKQPPLSDEIAPFTWIAVGQERCVLNPVGAEHPEILPQFTPPSNNAAGVKEGDSDRPDHAFAVRLVRIPIGDAKLHLLLHSLAQHFQVNSRRGKSDAADMKIVVVQPVAKFGRQDCVDFRECIVGRQRQFVVGLAADPLNPKSNGLQLSFGEHQWRQHETRPQHVAEAGLSVDFRAHGLKECNIPVDRSQRYTSLFREIAAGYGLAVPA